MTGILHYAAGRLGDWRRKQRGDARRGAYAIELATLLETEACAVYLDDRPGDTCIVSFTGIGHGTGGIELQRPEFVKAGVEGPRLFVLDKTRSWGNALDVAELQDVIAPLARGRRLVTLGNSMGAFLAILLSGPLGATRCLAFSPQWSVDPVRMPEETRWKSYREKIRAFRYPDLADAFVSGCRYDLVFGDDALEHMHAERFPERANLALYRVRNASHDVAAALKAAGCLNDAVVAGLTGGAVSEVLAAAGLEVFPRPPRSVTRPR